MPKIKMRELPRQIMHARRLFPSFSIPNQIIKFRLPYQSSVTAIGFHSLYLRRFANKQDQDRYLLSPSYKVIDL